MDQLKKKKNSVEQPKLAKKSKNYISKYKAAVQITAGMGWPLRPSSTQAILKIIKIKKN